MTRLPLLLYATDAEALGGAEHYLETLLSHADRSRFRVALALPPRTATQPLVERARARGVRVLPLDAVHHDGISPRGLLRSLALLARLRPQVLHVVLNGPRRCAELLLAAWLLGVPCRVASFQLVTPVPHFGGLAGLARRLNRAAQFRTLTHGIAVSQGNARLLIEQYSFPANRLALIHNGVDLDTYRTGESGDLRAHWGVPAGAPLLGCVGRLSVQKGQRVLVQAMPAIWRRVPEAHLVLVGTGERERELREQAEALGANGRVIFAGAVPAGQIPAALAAFDLFVLPSLYEGLPFALVEAMAAGKPIVATAVDGTAEALNDGACGLLVPPGDEALLAEAVLRLLRNPGLGRRLGGAAQDEANRSFSQAVMLAATFGLYPAAGGRRVV